LHRSLSWRKQIIPARGKMIEMKFQVLGPFVREGLPGISLFLILTKDMHLPLTLAYPFGSFFASSISLK
jgi:hypothetical protein